MNTSAKSAGKDGFQDLVAQIQAEASKLKDQRRLVAEEMARLSVERDRILDAPLGREDIKGYLAKLIDKGAAEYPVLADLKGTLDRLTHPTGINGELRKPGSAKGAPISIRTADKELTLSGGQGSLYGFDGPSLVYDRRGIMKNGDLGLMFFFGDIIKAKLAEYFDRLLPEDAEDATVPATVADRRARLADIEEDLQKLGDRDNRLQAKLQALKQPEEKTAAGPSLPRINKDTTRGIHTNPAHKYTSSEVMKLTGWNYAHITYAIKHEGFPEPVESNGQSLFPAGAVDWWVSSNARDPS